MHSRNKKTAIFLGDIFSLYLALSLTILIRFGYTINQRLITSHFRTFSMLFAIWIIVFYIFNLYELGAAKPTPRTVGRLLGAFAVNMFLGISFFYIVPSLGITPKINLLLVVLFSSIFIILWRRFFYYFFENSLKKKVAFYSESPEMMILKEEMKKNNYLGIYLGTFSKTKDIPFSGNESPDIIITPEKLSLAELYEFRNYEGELVRTSQAYELIFGKIPVSLMNEQMAFSFMKEDTHKNIFARVGEIIFAFALIIITLPLTLLSAIFIFLEDGRPIFYSQERVGKGGKTFTFYKLRTMKKQDEVNSGKWAMHDDSRVTKTGRILRTLHIDEIPQMWNIIKGDITLVGPRPEWIVLVRELEKKIPHYFLRHTIKPGFTGWAQIKYRYAATIEDTKEKFEYDLFYLKNKSLLLDIGIIVKTIQIIFTH